MIIIVKVNAENHELDVQSQTGLSMGFFFFKTQNIKSILF